MTTHTISNKWLVPFSENQTDAVWFYGHKHVGTTTLTLLHGETFSIEIHCDGETRYHIPYLLVNGELSGQYHVVRFANEWNEIGVHTDADIQALGERVHALGHDFHVYNSWFDLYVNIDGNLIHLDSVTHTVEDAESQAEAILLEVATEGDWEKYFNSIGWQHAV